MRIFAGALLAVLLAAVIGVPAYQLGLSQGLAQAGAAVPALHPYYASWHWGFGGFGLLLPLLFLLLFFGVLRGAFGGGWGHRRRGWYGPGGEHDLPPRVVEWHRRLHESEAAAPKRDASTDGRS